jgi:hypothetical protein
VCCTLSSSPSPLTDVLGCRRAASHGAGHHVRARSSSTVGFFLAYFDYRRRASTGYVHDHFCPSPFPPPTPSSSCTTTLSLASSPRLQPVYFDNRERHRHLSFTTLRFANVLEPPLLVSLTWRKVQAGSALRMLGTGNTAACFFSRRVPNLATLVWRLACGVFDKIVSAWSLLRRLPQSSPCLHHARARAPTTPWRPLAPAASSAATSTPATPTTT